MWVVVVVVGGNDGREVLLVHGGLAGELQDAEWLYDGHEGERLGRHDLRQPRCVRCDAIDERCRGVENQQQHDTRRETGRQADR